MTNEERERVLTLKEATRGMNPDGNVTVQVKDLDYLTGAVLALSPRSDEEESQPQDIDGGHTKEAKKEDDDKE